MQSIHHWLIASQANTKISVFDSLWMWCNKYRPMDKWFHISLTFVVKFASELSFNEWFTTICRQEKKWTPQLCQESKSFRSFDWVPRKRSWKQCFCNERKSSKNIMQRNQLDSYNLLTPRWNVWERIMSVCNIKRAT